MRPRSLLVFSLAVGCFGFLGSPAPVGAHPLFEAGDYCPVQACWSPVDAPRFRAVQTVAEWSTPPAAPRPRTAAPVLSLPPLNPAVRSPHPTPSFSTVGVRGVIRQGQTDMTMASSGFNTTTVAPYTTYLDSLKAAGMKGLVWLGQWNKTACTWQYDDSWIRSHVTPIAGHSAIAAYWIADEPSYANCPTAPAALKARTALLHSLDPSHPTLTVLEVSDTNGEHYGYYHWVDSVDVLGIDVYPCSHQNGCVWSKIDTAVAKIKEQNIPHFWAVLQDFEDDYYAQPTPSEIQTQFQHWSSSGMDGYLIYRWDYFSAKQDHLDAYKSINASYA